MDKKIKEVLVVFENCESIIIPYKHFTKLDIKDGVVNLKLEECYHSFLMNRNDIVWIDRIYEDGSKLDYCVSWCDDDDYTNYYQFNEFNHYLGSIEITISKNTYLEKEKAKCMKEVVKLKERLHYLEQQ